MTPYNDSLFGELRAEDGGRWECSVDHRGAEVVLHLNIDGDIDGDAVSRLSVLVSDLPRLERAARAAILADASMPGSMVTLYREHHARELSADDLQSCFGSSDSWRTDMNVFVAALGLKRIGLYPEAWDSALVMDFTIGAAFTDHLVVVKLDARGRVAYVTIES